MYACLVRFILLYIINSGLTLFCMRNQVYSQTRSKKLTLRDMSTSYARQLKWVYYICFLIDVDLPPSEG